MAASMTYNSLIADMKNYCERNDPPFVDQIPHFIHLAEERIASESKPLGYVRTVTGVLNGNTMVKPMRWRKTKSFSVITALEITYLYERGYEFCRSYAPNPATVGVPKYYANYDYEHFFIAPTPDLNYTFELQYYERPEPLSDIKQTNWTTQYTPQLLLYASLMEAMPFLKTSERIPEFQALYDRAMAAITKEGAERLIDNAAVRSQE